MSEDKGVDSSNSCNSAVSPQITTNVVSGSNKQCMAIVGGSIDVADNIEGEQCGDDNDRKVAICSVPVCPSPVTDGNEEPMCGVCGGDEAIIPKSIPEACSPT